MSSTSTTSSARVTRPSADATRQRIVAAAVDLFSERSFDGATTRDIAARAAVAQPLLNYHFRSKEGLWQAAVDSLFDLLNQAMDERASGLRGVDEITRAKLIVARVHHLLGAEPTTASDHHAGVQGRQVADGLPR